MGLKKKDEKPRTGTQKPERKFNLSSISDTFRNETFLFVSGSFLAVIAVFAVIAYISFLFTGGTDQSAVLSGTQEIENSTGLLGARFSEAIVNGWFGFSSILIPVFLTVCGLNMTRITHFKLFRWFVSCAFLMIWCSVFLQLVLSPIMQNSFIIPGGSHGMNLTNTLKGYIGIPGLILVLILTMVIYCVYLTKRTIQIIRDSAEGLKRGMRRKENKATDSESSGISSISDDPQQDIYQTSYDSMDNVSHAMLGGVEEFGINAAEQALVHQFPMNEIAMLIAQHRKRFTRRAAGFQSRVLIQQPTVVGRVTTHKFLHHLERDAAVGNPVLVVIVQNGFLRWRQISQGIVFRKISIQLGKIGRIGTGVVHQLVQTLVLQFLSFFRRHFVSFGDEAHSLFAIYCFHFQKY